MPIAAMAIPALISAGGSIAGGLLGGNKNKATEQPTWTPGQMAMQGTVADTLNTRLKKGGAGYFAPAKTAAISNVDDAYQGLQDSMQRSLIGRGFGSSGKVGQNAERLGISRAGQIGGIDANYDQMAAGFDQNTLQQALQFAFNKPGQQSTATQGSPFGNGINSALGTLGKLMGVTGNYYGGGGGGDSGGGGFESLGTMAPISD